MKFPIPSIASLLLLAASSFAQESATQAAPSHDAAQWLRLASEEADKVNEVHIIEDLMFLADLQGKAHDVEGINLTAVRIERRLAEIHEESRNKQGDGGEAYQLDAYAKLAGAYAQAGSVEKYHAYAAKTDLKVRPNAVIQMYAAAKDYPAMEKALQDGRWEGANQYTGAYYDAAERVAEDDPAEAHKLLNKAEKLLAPPGPAISDLPAIALDRTLREEMQRTKEAIQSEMAPAYIRIGDMPEAMARAATLHGIEKIRILAIAAARFAEQGDKEGLSKTATKLLDLYPANRQEIRQRHFSGFWPLDELFRSQLKLGQVDDAIKTLSMMEPQAMPLADPSDLSAWKSDYETLVQFAEIAGHPGVADEFARDAMAALSNFPDQIPEFSKAINDGRKRGRKLTKAQAIDALASAIALPNNLDRDNALRALLYQTNDFQVKTEAIRRASDSWLIGVMIQQDISLESLVREQIANHPGTTTNPAQIDLWAWTQGLPYSRAKAAAAMEIGGALIKLQREKPR